jgi:TRAP-type C4-dicarboxylate transport system substrate-binding protein
MKTWDKLPEDIQQAIQESVEEAIPIQREQNANNVNRLLEDLKEQGMVVNQVDNPELFRESVKPVYDEFEEEIGEEVMNNLFEAINN